MKTPTCPTCPGFKQSVFCILDQAGIDGLESSKLSQKFKPGQTLFHTGDPAAGLHCVQTGTVKLEANDSAGKSHLVQMISQGGIIGYRALFSDEPYLSSAIAVDEVETCFIGKKTILELVEKNPPFAMKFLTQLSQDFRAIEVRLQHATSHTAGERIAEALLFLRENFKDQNWTRREIAEWAGTTTETAIRTLAEFEKEGILQFNGRSIQILDRKALLERARISF